MVVIMTSVGIRQYQVTRQQVALGPRYHSKADGQRSRFLEHRMFKPIGTVRLRRGNTFGRTSLYFYLGIRHRFVGGMAVEVDRHNARIHDADQLKQIGMAADSGRSGAGGYRGRVTMVMALTCISGGREDHACYNNSSCSRTFHKGYRPIWH